MSDLGVKRQGVSIEQAEKERLSEMLGLPRTNRLTVSAGELPNDGRLDVYIYDSFSACASRAELSVDSGKIDRPDKFVMKIGKCDAPAVNLKLYKEITFPKDVEFLNTLLDKYDREDEITVKEVDPGIVPDLAPLPAPSGEAPEELPLIAIPLVPLPRPQTAQNEALTPPSATQTTFPVSDVTHPDSGFKWWLFGAVMATGGTAVTAGRLSHNSGNRPAGVAGDTVGVGGLAAGLGYLGCYLVNKEWTSKNYLYVMGILGGTAALGGAAASYNLSAPASPAFMPPALNDSRHPRTEVGP